MRVAAETACKISARRPTPTGAQSTSAVTPTAWARAISGAITPMTSAPSAWAWPGWSGVRRSTKTCSWGKIRASSSADLGPRVVMRCATQASTWDSSGRSQQSADLRALAGSQRHDVGLALSSVGPACTSGRFPIGPFTFFGARTPCIPLIPHGIANVLIGLSRSPGTLDRRLEDLSVELLAHPLDDFPRELVTGTEVFPPRLAHVMLTCPAFQVSRVLGLSAGDGAGRHNLGHSQAIGPRIRLTHPVPLAGLQPVPLGKDVKAPNLGAWGYCSRSHVLSSSPDSLVNSAQETHS